jgi:hypothetical protein
VVFQLFDNGEVVLVKPQVAQLDSLDLVHTDKVADVLQYQFLHLVK